MRHILSSVASVIKQAERMRHILSSVASVIKQANRMRHITLSAAASQALPCFFHIIS
jgi:hypothetical protein